MQSIRPFASLLSAALLLAACQTTPLQQPQGAPMAQSLSLKPVLTPVLNADKIESNSVFQGHFEVRANGSNAQISFVPQQSGGFSTQALRRSDIKKYRMTVSWPGNSTGISVDLDADAAGGLTGPMTVSSVLGGDFRTIILEALDADGIAIPDLTAGHVYHFSGTATQNANSLITRSGHAVAKVISHFSNSTVTGDLAIFKVWKTNPAGSLTDLNNLVTEVLTGKDAIALDPQELIAKIQAKADGSMPLASNISTSTASNVSVTYSVPAGFILPAGTRLSLDTGSSQAISISAAQAEGVYTVDIPNVYLPLGTATTTRRLRFFAANTAYATPIYSATSESIRLNNAGVEAGTVLELPVGTLTPLAAGSTFYVDTTTGDDGDDGSSEALAWKTLTHAITQIKIKTLNDDFDADTIPVLSVGAGDYSESDLTLDFPIQIVGAQSQTATKITSTTGGSAFKLGQDITDAKYATSDTKRISLSHLEITGFDTAINVVSSVDHLTLSQIKATAASPGAGVGFNVPANVSIDDLIMNNSSFNHYRIGLNVSASIDGDSHFSKVSVSSSNFSDNTHKGVFIEKADNISFDNITIERSGVASYNNNNGFMVYLKGGSTLDDSKAYSNIRLTNSTITDSAYRGTSTFPGAYARAAVVIGIYENNGNYATLSDVTITGNTISGPMQALRIASPDQNLPETEPSMISGITLENNTLALEENLTYDPSYVGYPVGGRFLIINHTIGDINAATGNTFDGINPATATDPEALEIEAKILDDLDFNDYQVNAFASGRVNAGLSLTP